MQRYLTKSRFKLGLECPTKLYYTNKKNEYKDTKADDEFLLALAEGGFQVGELAKYYYPNGHDIKTLDYEQALKETQDLLMSNEEVTIYEAALACNNLFIRVDILRKSANRIEIIEVKSKSYGKNTLDDPFLTKKGFINNDWKPYLYDLAFQYNLAKKCFPDNWIIPKLLLVDKSATAATDGLNQKFKLVTNQNNRKEVKVTAEITDKDLSTKLLVEIPAQQYIDIIYQTEIELNSTKYSFEGYIDYLEALYKSDMQAPIELGVKCKKCEFKTKSTDEKLKSGFKECWSKALNWTDKDFEEANVLEIWSNLSLKKHIKESKFKLTDFTINDFIDNKTKSQAGLNTKERQWLQVSKAQNNDTSVYCDTDGLRVEMSSWKFPLHFIDFETAMTAIPFHKGMKPYEGIAFQFSHHIYHADGTIEHADQFLATEAGKLPNFDFINKLKEALDKDTGTIFKYSSHENTYLNTIYWQLDKSDLVNKRELQDFIQTITKSKGDSPIYWEGDRNMVDLLEIVKRYYYDPHTKGSNSIKYVLPAILNSSAFLQEKYSKPIYGSENGIKSLNFKDKAWLIRDESGYIQNPYEQLPSLFEAYSLDELEDIDLFLESQTISNGGVAMTAYSRMQFTEMSDLERSELESALLKYCELDTLAMVMLYEAFREQVY